MKNKLICMNMHGTRLACLLILGASPTWASEEINLDAVEVTATRINLIGVAESASEGIVPADRIANIPLLRPGEVLEQTPGLIVSQHAGDGKANQYYLRGFNLDHGTDFAIHLDGMPINMPTHAHGQGYADANFLIPELVESIAFRKGPYFADEGDFSAAGATHLNYYRSLPQSIASLSAGENGYRRMLLAGSPQLGSGQWMYALETQTYDGPWDNPENLGFEAQWNGYAELSIMQRVFSLAVAAQRDLKKAWCHFRDR